MSTHHSHNRRRRQRRSIGTTLVTTAVVGYGAYRLAEWLWKPSDEEEQQDYYDPEEDGLFSRWSSWMLSSPSPVRNSPSAGTSSQQQPTKNLDPRTQWRLRRQRIFKCREESIKACETCWPALSEKIEEMTNTSDAMRQLRDLRASKDGHSDDLWREIYIGTLTRFLSTVYAHTLWLCMSTVQIHYVGGRMFRQTPPLEENEKSMLTASHQYMLKHGLDLLVPLVRKTILTFIDEWKATTTITKTELHALLRKIQSTIDGTFSSTTQTNNNSNNKKYARNWIRFVLPDDSVDEVWDICKSPVWDDAHTQLLNDSMHTLLLVFPENAAAAAAEEEIAVAKHMAPLKKSCPKLSQPENYKRWILMPTMLELGDISFQ